MGRKEKSFQAEFNRSVRQLIPDIHFEQIPNAPYSPHIIPRPIYKPYDCYSLHDGLFRAFELKVMTTMALPFSSVKPHQIDNLLQVERNGGIGFIVINISLTLDKNKMCQLELDKPKLNFVYYYKIGDFISFRDSLDRKSIPLSYMVEKQKQGSTISRIKLPDNSYGWDIIQLWKS